MTRPARPLALVALAAVTLAGCASTPSPTAGPVGSDVPPCPVEVVSVVVTVDPWSDVVRQLGGSCATVTTIVTGSSGDPHDFEPSPADNNAFTTAKLVVMNGLGYDEWAAKAIETMAPPPAVVDGGAVVGLGAGANPHIWYSPTYVHEVADAVTDALKQQAPDAARYFDDRAAAFRSAMVPYDDAVAHAKDASAGKSYVATEAVFASMADTLGLTDLTPAGYRNASANDAEPSPGDVATFETTLRDRRADALVWNPQTEGAVPGQLRATAVDAGVPVVEVTETPPEGAGFVPWQVGQLVALTRALEG